MLTVPSIQKNNASSLVRLGFHRSLVGGMSACPSLPLADLLIQNIIAYASLPKQSYPLNVQITPSLLAASESCGDPPYSDLSHDKNHNFYQTIKKCIRMKQPLDVLEVPN